MGLVGISAVHRRSVLVSTTIVGLFGIIMTSLVVFRRGGVAWVLVFVLVVVATVLHLLPTSVVLLLEELTLFPANALPCTHLVAIVPVV